MAEYMGRAEGNTNGVTRKYAVADGSTVTTGDFVTLTDGRIDVAGSGAILGVVEGNADPSVNDGTTATGDADGTVEVLVNIEKDARYLVETDGTVAEANVGDTVDVTGTTGEQVVGLDAGTQLIILGPGEGLRGADDTYAVVSIVDNQRQA